MSELKKYIKKISGGKSSRKEFLKSYLTLTKSLRNDMQMEKVHPKDWATILNSARRILQENNNKVLSTSRAEDENLSLCYGECSIAYFSAIQPDLEIKTEAITMCEIIWSGSGEHYGLLGCIEEAEHTFDCATAWAHLDRQMCEQNCRDVECEPFCD